MKETRKLVTLGWLKECGAAPALCRWFIKEYGLLGRPTVVKVIRRIRDLVNEGEQCPGTTWAHWSSTIMMGALLPTAGNNWSYASAPHLGDDAKLLQLDVEYARNHMRRKSA